VARKAARRSAAISGRSFWAGGGKSDLLRRGGEIEQHGEAARTRGGLTVKMSATTMRMPAASIFILGVNRPGGKVNKEGKNGTKHDDHRLGP
jgi:hypothetical protein